MINIVYLVMVFSETSSASAAVSIPQANMAQCQVNAKNHHGKSRVKESYCIVGVK